MRFVIAPVIVIVICHCTVLVISGRKHLLEVTISQGESISSIALCDLSVLVISGRKHPLEVTIFQGESISSSALLTCLRVCVFLQLSEV